MARLRPGRPVTAMGESARWTRRAVARKGEGGSLTTEYPANGSFSDHTHAVCMKLRSAALLGGPRFSVRVSYGQATKGVR
jgi:hypothetical protein